MYLAFVKRLIGKLEEKTTNTAVHTGTNYI